MLALKLLLNVAGALLLATALAIPLVAVVNRIRRARKLAESEQGFAELVEPGEIPWRGPLALALVACLPLLISGSIVIVPSGWARSVSARSAERFPGLFTRAHISSRPGRVCRAV